MKMKIMKMKAKSAKISEENVSEISSMAMAKYQWQPMASAKVMASAINKLSSGAVS